MSAENLEGAANAVTATVNTNDNSSSDNIQALSNNANQSDYIQENNNNPDSNSNDVDSGANTIQEDHPEWFMKDKFKSHDEQAKAYHELQKKMGKFWGAPKDNYTIEGIEGIAENDQLLANLMPAIKELGLSQDGFESLVKNYQQANINMMQKYAEDLKKELTENDVHTYKECNKWMQDNLTPEEIEMVQNNWLMTPEDFKLFNILRLKAAPSSNVPSSSADNTVKFETSKEVTNEKIKYKSEIREGKRVKDPNYENELAARFRDARSRELRNN